MMIKMIGSALVLVGAAIVGGEIRASRRAKLALREELYRFLLHIRLQISCFLRPPCEMCIGFESKELRETKFLDELASGEGLLGAFSASRLSELLSDEEGRVICELFSSLGGGYVEDEIKILDAYTEKFLECLEAERRKYSRDVRLVRTLSASGALGVIILFL